MEVKQLQKEIKILIDNWDKKRKAKHTKELSFIHLTEEVGELARQYVNKFQRPEKYNEDEFKNAVGDIIMFAFFLASLHDIDVEEAILKTIKEESRLFK